MDEPHILSVRIPKEMHDSLEALAKLDHNWSVGTVVRMLIETNPVYRVGGLGEEPLNALGVAVRRQCLHLYEVTHSPRFRERDQLTRDDGSSS
ncbi:MAG: hypothetical protein OXF93_14065 [Acidobacteria bacterium]|nr:hypothetical protein [Acidobacteriota bacterium]